jgi:hypothetical protein
MTSLTKEEKAWIKKVERILATCPKRFGFYCVGDADIGIFDKDKDEQIEAFYGGGQDFVCSLDSAEAHLGFIVFPTQVHSATG